MTSPALNLRPIVAEDVNFILSSWLQSYRKAPAVQGIPHSMYYDNYRPIVQRILEASDVTVACNPADHVQIMGYMVHRQVGPMRIISYLYVKKDFRGFGIAGKLFTSLGPLPVVLATHSLPWLAQACAKRNIVFNPFIDLKQFIVQE